MRRPLFLAVVLAFAGLLGGCRTSTQITLDVSTNVPCASWQGAAIIVGELGPGLENAAATATTNYCDATGHVGTLVAVPRNADDANVGFRIVGAVSDTIEACTRDAGGGCIVARRALNFIPHEALTVAVPLVASCEGVLCDPTSTCVQGECRSATIGDPGSCAGQTCGEGSLGALDGGTLDASADGGGARDGGGADATLSDAGADAGADAEGPQGTEAGTPIDAATVGCGETCALSLGASFTCALRAGAVSCWGENYLGELGGGTATTSEPPGAVLTSSATPLSGVTGIVSGYDTSCAFLGGGVVSCWGGGAPLALSDEQNLLYATSQSLLAGASAVSIGNYHLCWQHGTTLSCATVGPGETQPFGSPVDAGPDSGVIATVPPPAGSPGPFVQLVSSPYFTCVLDAAGTVYCLGDNDSNESNLSPASSGGTQTSFASIALPNGLPVAEIALTQQAACGRQGGHVVCWGSNYQGAAGGLVDGGLTETVNEIIYPDGGPVTDAVQMATGELHSCVLLGSTQVACWGDNSFHQLGRGEPVTQPGGTSTVAQVVQLADGGAFSGVTRVAAGGNHTCATTSDGTLWCWGDNAYGQTAPGDQNDRSTPTPVSY